MWYMDNDDDDYPPPLPIPEKHSDWSQKYCSHNWKKTVLIISTVEDCTKCGVKKEIYEKWGKEEF
jgi:hypothetical protein